MTERHESDTRRLNRSLMISWVVIVSVLFITYFIEFIKQERTLPYVLIFMLITGLPALLCGIRYHQKPRDTRLRYWIVAGYFLMYLFVLATGSTHLVFTYILPLLSFLILYHQPVLIMITGIFTMLINLLFIMIRVANHTITMANSKDAEIQIALLALCFAGSWLASRIYDTIHRNNEDYIQMLDTKSQQIQNMTFQTIETIANTIDAKDEYTQGHSRRVSRYSAAIAREMGMDEESVDNVRFIALLHDIGKIAVPDSVLNKPGRLTEAEYELMKHHTIKGGEILKDIGILPDLDQGAKYHHERYDGKGYPNGLKGEEIPLVARIIGLADAYDAMTSNRVYRKHLTDTVVMSEIRRCRGTQFDPEVTDAFLRYIDKNQQELIQEDAVTDVDDAGNRILKKFMEDQSRQTTETAKKDELTGAYNRSYGERCITLALRDKKGCLFLLNLDDMREINRKYGFRQGDYYLQQIVRILSDISPDMILSRFGGDEFLCFIPDITAEDDIQKIMDELLQKLKECEQTDPRIDRFAISVGITIHTDERKELQSLLSEADKALYHIKQISKNGYYFYREMESMAEDISASELANLIDAIRRKDNFAEESLLENQDFSRVFDFIRDMSGDEQLNLYLIMFTVVPIGNLHMIVEHRETAIHLLEQSILQVIRDEGAISHYSSMQRILVMKNRDGSGLDQIAQDILRNFYKLYDKKDIELSYDIAKVQE